MALVIAVAANIVLFSCIGYVAGILMERRVALFFLYLVVCCGVIFLAIWGAGRVVDVQVAPVLAALCAYAVPFGVVCWKPHDKGFPVRSSGM
jgi:hypothetical protein